MSVGVNTIWGLRATTLCETTEMSAGRKKKVASVGTFATVEFVRGCDLTPSALATFAKVRSVALAAVLLDETLGRRRLL